MHYIYDRDGHLIAEADAATGTTVRDYIWLPANDNGNSAPGGALSNDLTVAGAANDNTPQIFHSLLQKAPVSTRCMPTIRVVLSA